MNKEVVNGFREYFALMDFKNEAVLDQLYSEDIVFTDPIHSITGIENLKAYFGKLNGNLVEGTFNFIDESIIDNKAYLTWEMKIKLKRPATSVSASGITVLTVENKIIKQRDYFDAGEFFYENIPVIGTVIRFLKKKISQQ